VLVILSSAIGLLGIQSAQPIADIISMAITLPMVVSFFKTLPEDT
jgi:hypothetical protein